MVTLGDKLKIARKNKGYRQEDVAAILGVQRQAISQYERSANGVSRKNLEKLAELYNVELDYLKYESQTLGMLLEYELQKEFQIGNLTEEEKRAIVDKMIRVYNLVK